MPGDRLTIPARSTASAPSADSASRPVALAGWPSLRCPVPGATFMNDWGFPRDGGTRFHQGNDLFAPKGTTIYAPATGTIVYSSNTLGGSSFNLVTATGWELYGARLVGDDRHEPLRAGRGADRAGREHGRRRGRTHPRARRAPPCERRADESLSIAGCGLPLRDPTRIHIRVLSQQETQQRPKRESARNPCGARVPGLRPHWSHQPTDRRRPLTSTSVEPSGGVAALRRPSPSPTVLSERGTSRARRQPTGRPVTAVRGRKWRSRSPRRAVGLPHVRLERKATTSAPGSSSSSSATMTSGEASWSWRTTRAGEPTATV